MPDDRRPILLMGHSPDPDDAFMWWPLFQREAKPARIDTGRFRFEPVMADIETLNQRSVQADLEITAISCAHYPFVKNRYALTACGASMGENYGPKLVSRTPMTLNDLKRPDIVLAVPGERTSAFAVTSFILEKGAFRYRVVPFDQIIARIVDGEFAAGLIIHEGQLTFEQAGLHLITDVGAWWSERHHLPLPLGVNTIRRDLDERHGPGTLAEVTGTLRRSIEYALANRQEAIAYALGYARDMGMELADRFVGMYVNKWTVDLGPVGREAVRLFLRELHALGLTPDAGKVDFIAAASEKSIAPAAAAKGA